MSVTAMGVSNSSWLWLSIWCIVLYLMLRVVYLLYFHPLARFPGPKIAALTRWYEAYFDLVKRPGGTFMYEINRMHQVYGPIVRINPDELHVKDSTWADVLFVGPSQGIRDKYPPSAHMTGTPLGIFGTVSHHVHRKRRAAISGMFSKRAVNNAEQMIHKKVDLLCKRMEHQIANSGAAEMRTNYLALTTDTLSDYAFEESLDLLGNEQNAINWKRTIAAVAVLTPLARQFTWIIPLALKMPMAPLQFAVPDLARIVKLHRDLQRQASSAIQRQNHSSAEKRGSKEQSPPNGSKPQHDLFKLILESEILPQAEKERKRIAQEAFVIMAAGGETTGRVLTNATYFILAHKDTVMPKLKEELASVMVDPSMPGDLRKIEKLPWLTAVIKESLRITALVTSRLPLVSPEQQLRYKDWEIPLGTPVSMTLRDILLDPAIFDEPLEFRPERWLFSNPELDKISGNYLPFGRGSRMCIGTNLALAELYLAIATIFRRFDLDLHETIRERDIDIARDCFIGEVSLDSRGVWVKEAIPSSA